MNPRQLLIAASLAVLALLAALGWHWRHPAQDKATAAAATKTETAAPDTLHYEAGAAQLSYLDIAPVAELVAPALAPLPGKLAFDEDRTVRVASPVTGRVAELVATPGSAVKAGDVLAWINSPEFAQARADARKAEADLAMKRKALARTRELADLGVLARKDLESAQDDMGQAQAELDRAQAVLKNLDPTGSGTRYALRAPLAGILVDRTINPGMEVRPDAANPLFIVTDPTRLWAVFELAEQDMAKVHNGQNVRIDVDAFADAHFEGRIVYVGAALDPATRRINVRAALDNPDARLKPEMFARISPLDDSGKRAIAVPDSALVSVGLHHYVFVEEAPGTLKRREVQLGTIGERSAYVVAGLKPGERVVTRGAVLLNAELGEAK